MHFTGRSALLGQVVALASNNGWSSNSVIVGRGCIGVGRVCGVLAAVESISLEPRSELRPRALQAIVARTWNSRSL